MEAKHGHAAAQARVTPERTDPENRRTHAEPEPTREEAIALLEANLPVDWAVTFHHHTTPEGVRYIDGRSGELFTEIPTLQDDGKPA